MFPVNFPSTARHSGLTGYSTLAGSRTSLPFAAVRRSPLSLYTNTVASSRLGTTPTGWLLEQRQARRAGVFALPALHAPLQSFSDQTTRYMEQASPQYSAPARSAFSPSPALNIARYASRANPLHASSALQRINTNAAALTDDQLAYLNARLEFAGSPDASGDCRVSHENIRQCAVTAFAEVLGVPADRVDNHVQGASVVIRDVILAILVAEGRPQPGAVEMVGLIQAFIATVRKNHPSQAQQDSDPRGAGSGNDPAAGAAALVVTDQAKDSDTQQAHQEPPIATEMPVAAGPEAAGADGGGPPRFRPPQPPQPQQQASPPRRAAPSAPRPVVLPQPVAQGCLSLRDAAALGNANAQYSLGEMYANGTGGVTQDFTQAVSWYRQAAVQGHAEAQCRLGVMFENGSGVASNQILAMSWYRQAAKQNHCGAQFKLGEHYRDVKQNLREAYAWFSLAATNGHADALRARDEIAAQLTPDELDSAQQIMARYVAQSQPKK